MRPSILVADGHPVTRLGVKAALGALGGCTFEECDSLPAVFERLRAAGNGSKRPTLLIVDLNTPGMNGAASIRLLRESYPELRIAVLTAADDRNTILDCLGAGVHGYMLKRDKPDRLLEAVRTVMAGEVSVPSRMTERASAAGTKPASPTPVAASLTGRQQNVLALLLEGQSTKDIARSLGLGLGTIKVHLHELYRSLGARNRTEAIARVTAQSETRAR